METLIGQTKAKRADLGRAKGTVTSVNSSTRMEAVKLASETVTVTVTVKPSSPEAEEEASPDVAAAAAAAAAAETDAEAEVAAELRCSNVARIEGPRVRIPRIA